MANELYSAKAEWDARKDGESGVPLTTIAQEPNLVPSRKPVVDFRDRFIEAGAAQQEWARVGRRNMAEALYDAKRSSPQF